MTQIKISNNAQPVDMTTIKTFKATNKFILKHNYYQKKCWR